MKKLFAFSLVVLLAVTMLAAPALADIQPGTGSGFYVRDTANVLSAETEQTVAAYNAVLESGCDGAQLVVVTVSYLDGDADVAAAKLMNDWGVGDSEQANGMLLLLVANEHRGWLALGAGIDDDFTGDMADQYLEKYFWPDVDADRFDQAVEKLTAQLYEEYLDIYDYEEQYQPQQAVMPQQAAAPQQPQRSSGVGSLFSLIVLLFIGVVILWVLGAASRFTRMRRWGYGGGFFPIFWFGGRRRYRSYRDQFRSPPPPPGPGGPAGFGGPGGFMGGGFGAPQRSSTFTRPSAPRGGGFGGFSGGSGAGRSSGRMGSGFRGSGGGGHSGGRGGGRR